ncbi:MAG TPA: hypothetical protein PL045_04835, partial [Chitinophagaceae bacterium]|nr:hypothetical protein [Chitinophagaceae bacterium]
MQKLLLFISAITFFVSCKDKTVSLSGTDKVEFKDFAAAFKQVSFPYRISDTNYVKVADTLTISYTVLTEFVPDSVMKKLFPKNAEKLKIHPAGKIEKENELYLLANIASAKKTTLIAFLFNKEEAAKYLSNIVLLKPVSDDNYMHSISVTNEP